MLAAISIVLSFVLGLLFWFIGHVIRKELKIKEENELLGSLINISLGASGFLIVLNLAATITKSFLAGLIASLVVSIGIIVWQLKETKQFFDNLVKIFTTNFAYELVKKHTDKYFWILLGGINLVYGITAFSTTKLNRFGTGNTHVFNINQLVNDVYPIKYFFLQSLDLRYHYGADIFAATLSKITSIHPEISLDILTIIFLNLSFLALYSLTTKFLHTNKINKYLVPFAACLAWGPVTYLFTKNPGESIPQNLLEKVIYLAQNKLIDSAIWSGLVLHWFFEPSFGIGCFFFLISLYLTYRFFTEQPDVKFIIMLGVFLSSFVIIDVSKLVILILGIFIHLLISYTPQGNWSKIDDEKDTLRKLGILFVTVIILGLIHGNTLRFDKNLIPFDQFYKFGSTNIDKKFGPLQSNAILLLIYAFGFFQAYKLKHSWVIFILPYFISSLLIPYLVTIPEAGAGKILISANLIGPFALPLAVDFVLKKLDLREVKEIVFYSAFFVIISISTIMFFAFGDTTKPIFKLENKSLKYTGLQVFPAEDKSIAVLANEEELTFTKYLKSKNVKNQGILTEPQFVDVFTSNTGLTHILPPQNVGDNPVKKEILDRSFADYKDSLLLDSKALTSKKIHWLYLSPRMFRFVLFPETRKILLNAYLNKGVKLSLSNNKKEDILNLKELYEIDPRLLSSVSSENFPDLLHKALKDKDKLPAYIEQIALSNYFGIYNAKSSDFDGDKISDIAFYDHSKKIWYIIHGKDLSETEVDLNTNLFSDYKGTNLLIPIPADYDGDSKTDIALFNKSNSTWYVLKSSTSGVDSGRVWCTEWSEYPLPADIDGDNKADISCYNSRDRRWPALLTTTNGYHTNTFDTNPIDITLYSDLDGDNKADYVVYKPDQGLYDVYLASCLKDVPQAGACGGPGGAKSIKVNLGTSSSRAVPADFDGDGKIDLGTWTPETGKWEIAFANTFVENKGGSSQYTFTLGKPGDIPMPGDYNGDGKDDIAIYHQSTSELEIAFDKEKSRRIDLSKYKSFMPASFIGI